MLTNVSKLFQTSNLCVLPGRKNGDLYTRKGVTPDLFMVRGVAPTYTNKLIGGVFYDLTMNWWVYRRNAFKIDYGALIGDPFSFLDLVAVNQFFLKEEAEIFKNWIDGVYPEEKTEMIRVDFPIGHREPYPFSWNKKKKQGSFWSNPADWNYDLAVCYYIDTNNVKVRAIQ